MKYHPDKNPGDALAAAVFVEIADAYKTLSNPSTRREYDGRNTGNSYKQADKNQFVTRDTVINDINNLEKTVAESDHFRLNVDALFFRITQILSPDNMGLFDKDSPESKRMIIVQILRCCRPLSYFNAQKAGNILLAFAGEDEIATTAVNLFLQQSLRASRWEKYKILVAVIVAVILCLLIFLLRTPSAPP